MSVFTADPLFDTNILLHIVRKSALGEAVLSRFDIEQTGIQPLISAVTLGEIYSLAYRLQWGQAKLRRLSDLLAGVVVVPLDYEGLTEAYARIDARCRSVGRPIGENDCWIAVTAKATGAQLITTDSDFDSLYPAIIDRGRLNPRTL
jgi:tRNA(fMet)-specific endonuclease VapC